MALLRLANPETEPGRPAPAATGISVLATAALGDGSMQRQMSGLGVRQQESILIEAELGGHGARLYLGRGVSVSHRQQAIT